MFVSELRVRIRTTVINSAVRPVKVVVVVAPRLAAAAVVHVAAVVSRR